MNAVFDLIANYKDYIPYVVGVICCIALIFGIIVMLMLSVWGWDKKAKPSEKLKQKRARDLNEAFEHLESENIPFYSSYIASFLSNLGVLQIGPIFASFFQVMKILKLSTFDRNWKYRLPMYLVIGPKSSGKSTLLSGLSLMHMAGESKVHENVWHLFDEATLFEVPSNAFFDKDGFFWKFLVDVFCYFRPRRPLDGVILSIPADMLDGQHHGEMTQYARETVFKLSVLQNTTNFRVPAYLIVTKSDSITGFSDFCSELSSSEKGQIIGWSSTEDFNAGTQFDWLENALNEISAGLRKASLFLARNRKVSANLRNAIFVKTGIDYVIRNLNEYISIIIKQSEKISLRGVYFVSVNNEKTKEIPQLSTSALSLNNIENKLSSVTNSQYYALCFADDLFQEKIFKEQNLARPINVSTLHVNRQTWIKRGIAISFAVTWTLGWYAANENIKREIKNAEYTLRSATGLMRKINVIEDDIRDHTDQQILKQETRKLLQLISGISHENLSSIFVPASWLSSIKSKITYIIGLLFDSSATKTVFLDLSLGAKSVGRDDLYENNGILDKKNPFDVSSSAAFKTFKTYVDKIIKLEKMEIEYNRIRKLDDPVAINNITKEIFQETFEVTDALRGRNPNFRFTAPQFHLDQFQTQMRNDAVRLFKNYLDEIFSSTIDKIFAKLCEDIDALFLSSQHQKEVYTVSQISKLYEKVSTLSKLVDSDSFRWLKEDSFSISPADEYLAVFSRIEASKVLGHTIARDLLEMANKRFLGLKDKLIRYSTTLTGNVFADDKMSLSDGFKKFKSELEAISKSSLLVQEVDRHFVSNIAIDQILIWDVRILESAVNIINSYNDFSNNKLSTFRSNFQPVYKEVLRKMLKPCILSILARSQNFEDYPNGAPVRQMEMITKRQVNNLSNILPYISKIAQFFDDGVVDNQAFAHLLIEQANSVLRVVDALFDLEPPYAVGDSVFRSWDGNSHPMLGGADASDDLKQYLAKQYKRMQFLAKELATPAINILESPGIEDKVSYIDLKEKWRVIIEQVDAFEKSQPGNSISALEQFVSDIMSKASVKSLQNDIEMNNISNQNGDYFINQRAKIAKALMSRATNINLQKAYNLYSSFANFFNQEISGRFPFGETVPEECSLTAVQRLIEMYKTLGDDVLNTLKRSAVQYNIPEDVIEFLELLPNLIEFLSTWLEHSHDIDPNNALVSFKLDTRVNIDSEIYGNLISEREVLINGISQDDENMIIVHNGDAVSAEFPFVISGNEIELEPSVSPEMTVSEDKVTFSYAGDWGILKLIEKHRVNKSASLGGTVMEFAIPIVVQATGEESEAKVYMKAAVSIRTPGGSWRAIPIPVFPDKAPLLPNANF